MKFDVVGRETRQFKDDVASDEAGHIVKKEFIILHCVNDPARKDRNVVEGRQVQSFRVYPDNGLFSDIKALDIPCVINAEVSRINNASYLDDFELIE